MSAHESVMINRYQLPDFIIVGAMKAGTTSLHYILNQHNNVFIPGGEIYFFDIDDIQQHPDFFIDGSGQWIFHDYDQQYHHYLEWYHHFFRHAVDGQLVGEDSTTYMASGKAPPRIAKLLPDVKLIFMLRDPVTRAYSHYWHLVNSGRAIYDFESTLRHTPGTILQRGYYKEQIWRFMQYFPKHQLKFIVFEEFTRNIQTMVDSVCVFLGLPTTVNTRAVDTHRNIGTAPRSLRLKLRANRIHRKTAERLYQGYLPTPRINQQPTPTFGRFLEHLSPTMMITRLVSHAPRSHYPAMATGVREFLELLYAKENIGLGELIGVDLERYWPYMKKPG
jgi:sulfotransferase family protein